MKKRILSILLVCVMLIGLLPTAALAADGDVAQIGEKGYATLAEAVGVATEGQTISIVKEGTYPIPNPIDGVVIDGTAAGGKEKVSFDASQQIGQLAKTSGEITFKNVTFNFGTANYTGFQHPGKIIFENCNLNGFLTTYGDMTFTGCTLTSGSDQYAINFYGGSNFALTNCHFYGVDKNVYIYQETLDGDKNVKFTNCDFHMSSTENTKTKSAVMLNAPVSWNKHTYNVILSGCTAEGGMNTTAAENVAGNTNYQGLYGLKHIGGGGANSLILGSVTVGDAVVYSCPNFDKNDVTLFTADDLMAFAAEVKKGTSFSDKTVKLGADIDLAGGTWPMIDGAGKNITFDGQNHTISNMTTPTDAHNGGFFSTGSGCTIKNVNFNNATVVGIGRLGVVCGHGMCVKIENCKVTNSTVTAVVTNNDDGDKAGAICGYLSGEPDAWVKGCTVEDCIITGYRDVGGAVGYAGGTYEVSGNTVKNSSVFFSKDDNYQKFTTDDEYDAGAVIGDKGTSGKAENNTATENVTVKVLTAGTVDIGEGESAIAAEVIVEQKSEVAMTGEGVAEEIAKLDDTTKTAISNNTSVTGVKLTTKAAGEEEKSGLQAVVNAAIENNQELAKAIGTAETVNIEVKVDVVPTTFTAPAAATQEVPETIGTVTFELKPTATVTVGTGEEEKSATVPVENSMIDTTKPITVSIYTGFKPAKVVHKGDDGFEEVFRETGDKTFTYKDGVCTLTISHFSTLTAVAKVYVAQTGDENQYETLAKAIAAVPTTGTETTITILENIDETFETVGATVHKGQKVILDLAGHTVAGTSTGSGYTQYIFVENGGYLTINDGSEEKTGKITYLDKYINELDSGSGTGGAAIKSNGCLTVNAGTIENLTPDTKTNDLEAAIDMYTNAWGEAYAPADIVLNIEDGVIKSNNSNTVRLTSFSAAQYTTSVTVNMNGGEVCGRDGFFIQGVSEGNLNTNTLNLNGGKVYGTQAVRVMAFQNSANENQTKPVKIVVKDTELTNGYYATSTKTGWEKGICIDNLSGTFEQLKSYVDIKRYVAQIDTTKFYTLADAIAAVPTDGTKTKVVLLSDISAKSLDADYVTINGGRNVDLDMNGHTIAIASYNYGPFTVDGGTLELSGKGIVKNTYEDGFWVVRMKSAPTQQENYSFFTQGKDVELIGADKVVYVTRINDHDNYGTVVNLNGKCTSDDDVVYVHGNVNNTEYAPIINFGATANIGQENYIAGYATVNVADGAVFTSEDNCINMAAGELNINGGSFTGGNVIEDVAGSGGSIDFETCCAVFVKQHTTRLPITINIKGGTFKSYVPFNQATGQADKEEPSNTPKPKLVTLNISGGKFLSTATENRIAVKSADKTGFITGGLYSEKVDAALIADGYVCVRNTDTVTNEAYPFIVKPAEIKVEEAKVDEDTGKITVGEDENGEPKVVEVLDEEGEPVSTDKAQAAATAITETLNNPEVTGFADTKIEEATKVTEENKEQTMTTVEVGDQSFDLSKVLNAVNVAAGSTEGLDSSVTANGEITVKTTEEGEGEKFVDTDVTKQITVDLTAATVETVVGEGTTTTVTEMTFEVQPVATIAVTDGEGKSVTVTAVIPNDAITAPITFRLPVHKDVNMENAAVYHDGEFIGTYPIQTEDGNKFIEVSSMSFSPFSYKLFSTESAVAKIGEVPYQTLAEAVAAVENNQTIVLLNDVEVENITIGRKINFFIDKNGKENKAKLVAADGYAVYENAPVEGNTEIRVSDLTISAVAGEHGSVAPSDANTRYWFTGDVFCTVSGGTLTVNCTGNTSITYTATPSDGYEFVDWAYSINNSGSNTVLTDGSTTISAASVTGNIVFKATFARPQSYVGSKTITFDANGGNCDTGTDITDGYGKLASLPMAYRFGYTFDGWYTAAVGGTKITTDTVFGDDATVYAHWTKNSSSSPATPVTPSYSITGADTKNGTFTVDKKTAASGSTVKITVTPDKGFTLETLTVLDKNGKEIEVKNLGNNKFSFKMPSSKVTVEATFMEVGICPQDETCVYAKFTDADTKEWYHDGVHYCVENGMMNGVSDTQFAPSGTLTRGMVVTVLARLDGVIITSTGNEWYADGQEWAVANGISDGTNMTANITREELATMLYRYAQFKGIDVNKIPENTNTLSHADVFTISDWATSGMHFCIAVGVVGGDDNGMLNPHNNATRAEAATMFQRFCERVMVK